MRCLVVADLHFNLRQFAWIERHAAQYSAIVFAGDLLDLSGHRPLAEQLRQLRAILARLRSSSHVLVASGNHDVRVPGDAVWHELLVETGCFVDGDTVIFDQAAITLCPWGEAPVAEAALSQLLGAAAAPIDRPWIWVHHEPPAGARVSRDARQTGGNGALAQLVRRLRPDLVLSGHIHDAPFVRGGAWIDRMADTWLINPGRQPGEVPAHVVLDLDLDEARWSALGVLDERRLGLAGGGCRSRGMVALARAG